MVLRFLSIICKTHFEGILREKYGESGRGGEGDLLVRWHQRGRQRVEEWTGVGIIMKREHVRRLMRGFDGMN